MSTCQGALPPHDNCPRGDRCDWNQPIPEVEGRTSMLCDMAKHATCSGCSCSCHRIRSLRLEVSGHDR